MILCASTQYIWSEVVLVQGGSAQPPEERYRSQLEQLTSMGFSNQEANIQGNFSV